jgi:hypothetical protein
MKNAETCPRTGPISLIMRRAALVALLAGVSMSLGCANGEVRLSDPFDRKLTLEEAQDRYTVLIRWSKFQEAKNFVDRDDRVDFIKRMKAFDEARFTDFESEPVELDAEKQTATIRVVYTLYLPTSPFEIELSEVQEWTRNGRSNVWQVYSVFEPLNGVASN